MAAASRPMTGAVGLGTNLRRELVGRLRTLGISAIAVLVSPVGIMVLKP